MGLFKKNQKKKCLLIIDDSDLDRALLCGYIPDEFDVVTAADGAEGLHAAERHRPDLIFVDLNMPHMDGFHFLGALRHHPKLSGIHAIVLTGQNEMFSLDRAVSLGAIDFISKDAANPKVIQEKLSKYLP